ncbi:hypothetical protein SUDANB6_05810 [Streptomyces sp. enrichment culture]
MAVTTAGKDVRGPGARRARRVAHDRVRAVRLADADTLYRTPIGAFRSTDRPVHDSQMADQLDAAVGRHGKGDLAAPSPAATPGRSPADRTRPGALLRAA